MILLIISFLAGVLTVLAPCTLTLLPVIVGSSVVGVPSKKKVLVVTLSLGFSIILFTFLLKVSTLFVSIPQGFWSGVSGLILIGFGLITIFPKLWDSLSFSSKLNTDSNRLLATGYKKDNTLGNIIIGISLGPVFSSCSPTYFVILATVLPSSFALGFIYLLAYTIGICIMLIAVSFIGQRIIQSLGKISDTYGIWRRSLGVLFIVLGLMVMFGFDKEVEKGLLDRGFFDITKIEQSLLKLNENSSDKEKYFVDSTYVSNSSSKSIQKTRGPKAPEIVNPSGFINTDGKSITIGEFKGKKVVLLDIWTYSCINCQRTLPYIQGWYEKYKDNGFVVIGLHTPEFAFEKVKSNVEMATKKFGLSYPVVMDNDYSTWTAYGNQYWPRKYLISSDGEIIYDHIGEGNYEETEKAIQNALYELNGVSVETPITEPKNVIPVDSRKVGSPEVYFGANRNEYLGNGVVGKFGEQTFSLPKSLKINTLYLEGGWNFDAEFAMSETPGKIVFKYNAKNVYMVASSEKGMFINIRLDGKNLQKIFIQANQLYSLVEGGNYGEHILEIEVPYAGLSAFTFTFG